jgi:hypothetical protein
MCSWFSRSLTTLLMAELVMGCMSAPVLPPPAASIPAPPTPDFAGTARRVPAPVTEAGAPRPGSNPWRPTVAAREWQYIVIHHTATTSGSVESINAAHLKNKDKNGNPWLGIGYHFVIGNGDGMPDGAIEPTFRWRAQIQGAHAGSSNKDYNERGIGVCLVGNFENLPPTAAQRKSIKLLVATLRAEYKIPTVGVIAHKDIRASATECPGRLFPMAEVAGGDPGVLFGSDSAGMPVERVASTLGSYQR